MSDETDAPPSPHEPELVREEQERRALTLSDEIARKYSRERLSRFVVEGAGTGEKLDLALRSEMERRLGGDFGNVRIFRGPFAEAVTRRHRADAVTIANTGMILVREGPRADTSTARGKALLAHELTHVKQAQRGLHFSKTDGGEGNAPLEREAAAAEAATYAAETGGGAGVGAAGGGEGVDGAALEQKVIERTLELIELNARWQLERLGG